MICRRIEIGIMIRRLFAGSIVAILLWASSLAAACDLSCAFASMSSDCHSEQTSHQDSTPGGMKMDGTAMTGMTMPEMSNDDSINQQMVSAPSRTMPVHAAVVDMGACERQTCDQAPVLAAKANHPAAATCDAVRALTGFPCKGNLQTASHDARDDFARLAQVVYGPLRVTLRV
jgi:hypothetical protein